MLKKIVLPIFREICTDAPPDLLPDFNISEAVFTFPNGAQIHLAGCSNGRAENLRGTAASLCIVDEAGFCDDLEYLVHDILQPQLLTTGGKLLMASTPPRTPAHAFVKFCGEAELTNSYSEYTIHHTNYPPDVIQQYCLEAGGEDSTTWKREYLCQFVVDSEYAVVPEWDDKYSQTTPRDAFFQYYGKWTALDIGVRDNTAIIFGYYDFKRAALIIESEEVFNGSETTTQKIKTLIESNETTLQYNEYPKSIRRVSDNNNLILINDLRRDGVSVSPTDKDSLHAMVNKVRMWVQAGRILIDPKCVQTIGCLKYAAYNSDKTMFERSAAYGHFDALASLIYLVRNIDESNPIPATLGLNQDHLQFNKKHLTENQKVIKDMFVPRHR